MSSDRLHELHEVAKDPLRQKILLKLGQHNRQDFDDLTNSLKITDPSELSKQLGILQELTVEGEHIVNKQENAYALTEKGHVVLNKIITFPELASNNYREKLTGEPSRGKQAEPRPKRFTLYWAALFASTLIVVGIIIPVFGHQSLDRTIFYAAASLLIIGFGYIIRVKPSVTLNKVVYVGLVGFVIGVALWFTGLIIAITSLPRTGATDDALFVVLTTVSFTAGPLIGYFIGKARNFKGPARFGP
jgi:DNA-binding HxlR family transcriptional regulator